MHPKIIRKNTQPPQVLADTNLANLLREQQQQQERQQEQQRCQRKYYYEGNREFPLEGENQQYKSTTNGNPEEICVTNLVDGESLCYSLALIRGRAPIACNFITVRNQENQSSEWPIVSGEFRAIVELTRGPNKLEFETAGQRKGLVLIHEPRTTRLRVTPVYVICSGHDGYFQGPRGEDRSPESAATRIGLGARLLQTLTAEKLREAGYGRKTFQLERDLDGAECLVMHSMLDVDRARAMNQRELWELIARELMTGPLASKDRKYLAFLSCTRYRGAPNPRTHEDTLARTQGHAALGGGGLALFGSACLHTWPTCMAQILSRFLDATIIDTEQLMDDSNYRGTHGGCFATTLGAVLHELGHTFDLGHTREGIMGRGFDYVDRVFVGAAGIDFNRNPVLRRDPQHTTIALSRPLSVTVTIQEPYALLASPRRNRLLSESSRPSSSQNPSRLLGRLSAPASPELNRSFSKSLLQTQPALEQTPNSQTDRTFWSPSCAAFLAYHRWFNSEMDNVFTRPFHDIEYDGKRNVIRSRFGVRVIELRETSGGMVVGSRQFPGSRPPLETLVPLAPPHIIAALTLVAEDSTGNILKYPLPTAF
ncbi:Putative zinc metalloproteinase [Apis cerana cerana]|uniref:Zinc metalloproteinase n=1 Tax=Apis cerana cerana TaxID=94128 RepID=A0A2A3E9H8_APICC|nr:Putative zinc metalloproteinase [Apis cerana cerana]